MIDVSGLCFTYPGSTEKTVSGLDFSVQKGEIFGFLGPSGAGKPAILLIEGAMKGITLLDAVYAVATLCAWIVIAYKWAYRWFYRYTVLGIEEAADEESHVAVSGGPESLRGS